LTVPDARALSKNGYDMRLLVLVLVVLATSNCSHSSNNDDAFEPAAYLIPESYQPEPGPLDRARGVRQIAAREFSFTVSRSTLLSEIPEFDSAADGMRHDLMIIVQRYDPETMDEWEPGEQQLGSWRDLWIGSGSFGNACIGMSEEPLTEYIFYYKTCDPNTVPEGGFFLLNQKPDPQMPAPIPETYVLGSCLHDYVDPDSRSGPYIDCHFLRKTEWKDQYSFWLRGKNLRLLHEVESLIERKLGEWRIG